MADLPTSIWEGTFPVFGREIKCYQLSNGKRIIDAESLEELFSDIAFGTGIDPTEMDALFEWVRGACEPKVTTEEPNQC